MKVDFIMPLVVYLCHDSCNETGAVECTDWNSLWFVENPTIKEPLLQFNCKIVLMYSMFSVSIRFCDYVNIAENQWELLLYCFLHAVFILHTQRHILSFQPKNISIIELLNGSFRWVILLRRWRVRSCWWFDLQVALAENERSGAARTRQAYDCWGCERKLGSSCWLERRLFCGGMLMWTCT